MIQSTHTQAVAAHPYIQQNAFRVLGLNQVSVADVCQAKKLEALRETGLYGSPQGKVLFPECPIQRDMMSLEQAETDLKNPALRILHEFFWFEADETTGTVAIDALQAGDYGAANAYWSEQLTAHETGVYNALALKHLAVLQLWRYCVTADEGLKQESHALWASIVGDDAMLNAFLARYHQRSTHIPYQSSGLANLRLQLLNVLKEVYISTPEERAVTYLPPAPSVTPPLPPVAAQASVAAPTPTPPSVVAPASVEPHVPKKQSFFKSGLGIAILSAIGLLFVGLMTWGILEYNRTEPVTLPMGSETLRYDCYVRDRDQLGLRNNFQSDANLEKLKKQADAILTLDNAIAEQQRLRQAAETERNTVATSLNRASQQVSRHLAEKQRLNEKADALGNRYNAGANEYSSTPGVVEYAYSGEEYMQDLAAIGRDIQAVDARVKKAQEDVTYLNGQVQTKQSSIKGIDEHIKAKEAERATLQKDQADLERVTKVALQKRKAVLDELCRLTQSEQPTPEPTEANSSSQLKTPTT
jgi:hypothetical protein